MKVNPSHTVASFGIVLLVLAAACTSTDGPAGSAKDGGTEADEWSSSGRIGVSRRVDVPSSGVELGLGWDTTRGETISNRCVEFAPVQETGQVATLNMREVSDQSEIMESLGVGAAMSVKTMFASGSAQASFARDAKVKANSTNLMLEATVENGVVFAGPPNRPPHARKAFPEVDTPGPSMDDPSLGKEVSGDAVRLKPWARQLLEPERVHEFRRHCGDSFVSALYSGAELLSTIQFQESDTTTRESLKAAITASYGPGQVSAKGSSERTQQLKDANLTIHYLQVGGGGGTIPTSREGLKEKLEKLAEEARVSPRFHAMEVTAYTSLADWPPTGALSARAEDLDEVVADYYWFLTTLQGDVEDILRAPANRDFRSGLSAKALAGFQDQIIRLRRSMVIAMEAEAEGALPESPLEPASYEFFPQHKLEFQSLNRRLQVTDKAAAPPKDQWFRDFAQQLKRSVPYGNPNVLKILLPLPCGMGAVKPQAAEPAHRKAVVDWYVRPQSMRMCELDPTDNECLTNAELTELEKHVPYNAGPGTCPQLK